jgi:hypothetical protein
MAPVQQTFQVIPNGAGGAATEDQPEDRPPMTTKQAKKAYKAKKKGPKLSKTEQRRQDLLEQDRIRRELEKERNQARARTARDKRREKEDREKAEKRRKGLPLVDVHPSQDTISRFIRRAPTPAAVVHEGLENLALGAGQERKPDTGPHIGINEEDDTNGHEEEYSVPVDVTPAAAPVKEDMEEKEDSNKAPSSRREDSDRPAKRQRIITMPLHTVSAPDLVPDGMFKRPKSRNPFLEGSLSPRVSGNDAVAHPSYFDAGSPAIEEGTANKQKQNESFSIDDEFFDGIDLDEIDAKVRDNSFLQSASSVDGRPSAGPPRDLRPPTPTEVDTRFQGIRENPRISKTTTVPTTDSSGRKTSSQTVGASENVLGDNIPTAPSTRGSLPTIESGAHTARRTKPISAQKQVQAIQLNTATSPSEKVQRPRLTVESGKPAKDSRDADRPLKQPPDRVSLLPPQQKQESKSLSPAGTANSAPKQLNVTGNQGQQALGVLPLNQSNDSNSRSTIETSATKPKNNPQRGTTNAPVFRKPQAPSARTDVLRSPKTPMGPPPIPPKFRSSDHLHPSRESRGPVFLSSKRSDPKTNSNSTTLTAHGSSLTSYPPSSTQAFLLSHVDDLFPTPSQEVEELFERPEERTARISPRSESAPPRRPGMLAPMNYTLGEFPKPSCAFPTKSTRDIPKMAVSLATASPVRTLPDKKSPYAESKVPHTPCIDFMSFLSTQDVMLSSQDLQELEEESPMSKDYASVTMGRSQRAPPCLGPGRNKLPALGQKHSPKDRPSIQETTSRPNLPSDLTAMDTIDRILGPGFHSQQSSSLPDTPSVPRSRVAAVPPTKGDMPEVSKQVEVTSNSSNPAADLFGEDISGLLDEDEDILMPGDDPKIVASEAPLAMQESPRAAQHSSPKRFFTSSGTKEKVYLALERLKPNAWVDDNTRLKHQEELDLLFKKAEEKAAMEGIEKMLEEEGEGQTVQPYPQDQTIPSSDPRDREARSSGQRRSQSQKSKGGSQRSCCAQPQSSYEKMLVLANGPPNGEDIIPASQDSDYSDVPWDDDLMRLCS